MKGRGVRHECQGRCNAAAQAAFVQSQAGNPYGSSLNRCLSDLVSPQAPQKTYQIWTMGLPFWHVIRGVVKQARVHGYRVQLIEGPGWLSRDFRIEGTPEGVQWVNSVLDNWVKETGGSET